MEASAWKASVGFSERMSNTMKLMSAYKSTFPDLTSIELQARARSVEEEAFKKSLSKESYQKTWTAKLQDITLSSASPSPVPTTGDHLPDDTSIPFQWIGSYKAKHYASGITSTVYQATDPVKHTPIAIKLTTPHTMSAPHHARREARLLNLASHKSIVPLLGTESIAGGHFLLIFPFLAYDFGSLLHRKQLKKSQIKAHLHSFFAAIEHIHSLGIIHRDIKPTNLFLASPSGPAYLGDFGISWQEKDPDSESADHKITDVGTTCYRPPELLFGNTAYGQTLDMWSAGCAVAEAFRGGKTLFDGGDVGSELALVKSIFSTLGTPNETTWPEAKHFRDWGKMQFEEYPAIEWSELLRDVGLEECDLVSKLVRFQSTERLSAAQALKHPYFAE